MSISAHREVSIAQTADDDQVAMRWRVHLARKHPTQALLCGAAIAAAMVAGYHAVGALGPIAAVGAMVGSLSEFLFPMTYEITRDGASCRTLLKSAEIKWDRVRRCYVDDCGVKLSPLTGASRLEAFRGVYLRFDGNRDQVVEAVRSLRSAQCME